jgi:Zn finger protein HypA/HybF involved in hydrogenase expression
MYSEYHRIETTYWGSGERRTVATRVIERLDAHYEVQDVEMGKVYKWRPKSVVVECEECGKKPTLTASKHTCEECGADHRPVVEQLLEARPDGDEDGFDHPWRSLRPYYAPTRGT